MHDAGARVYGLDGLPKRDTPFANSKRLCNLFCAKRLLPEGSYITVVANGTHIMIEYCNFQIAAGVPSLQVYLAQVRLIGHHVSSSLCTTMKAAPLLRVRCQHSQ